MRHRTSRCRVIGLVLAAGAVLALTGCMTTVPLSEEPDTSPERQAKARRDVGMDHLSKGRTSLAIRELLAAERLNGGDKETHLWLGEAYRRKGMLEKAEKHIVRAVELDPEFHASRLNLSGLYVQMERYQDAIEQATRLAEDPTFPTPWKALTNRAYAELQLGRLQQARRSLDRALDYHPTYWPALLNLGIVEHAESKPVRAIERFEQVLSGNPGPDAVAEVHFRMGEVFVGLGHRDRAIRHFSSAIDVTPHGLWGEESKRYLKLLR